MISSSASCSCFRRNFFSPYGFCTTGAHLRVSVYKQDLLAENVDVIACATNTNLDHRYGLARTIAEKAGYSLTVACRDFNRQQGGRQLNIGDVMHTASGKLSPNIRFVIFVVGPVAGSSSDDRQLRSDLIDMFYNCLCCANDTLCVRSIALPALCSGSYQSR